MSTESARLAYIPLASIKVETRQREEFNEKALEALKTSILTLGLINPLTVLKTDDAYTLIAGERRLRVLTSLFEEGILVTHGDRLLSTDVPVTIYTELTEEQLMEIELDENLRREDLTWKEEVRAIANLHKLRKKNNPLQTLAETSAEIKESRGDQSPVTSYDRTKVRQAELLESFLDNEKIAKARNEKEAFRLMEKELFKDLGDALDRTTIPGNTSLGKPVHTLYFGDMKHALSVCSPGSFKVAIIDPPYGIGVANFGSAQELSHNYQEEDFEEVNLLACQIITKLTTKDAHAYIFCDIDYFHTLRATMTDLGWKVRRSPLIYNKGSRGHLADGKPLGYRRSSEFILFAKKGNLECNALESDILTAVDHKEKYHAAQKSVALYKLLLKQSATVGDRILDLFAGSGTIFEAASQLNMQVVGFEKDEETVALIEAYQSVMRTTLGGEG